MANIASISVGLFAKTARFEKSMKKSRHTLSGFGSSAVAMGKKVAGVGAALAGLAGAGSIAYMTKESFSAIDATAKLADRLGETTERLQGLRHAAELTGAGTETMDKALEKMQKTFGEVKAGTGEGKVALDKLGLSVQNLMAQSPAEQFATIADRVKGLTTAEERAFVATKLFGDSGQKLINTLALGSDGLAQAQREAEKLGIAFSRFDAAKVEAANDAVARLKSAFNGIFNSLAIKLAPYVTEFADRLTALAASGEGMGARISSAFKWIAMAAAKVSDYVNLVEAGFYTLASGLGSALKGAIMIFRYQWGGMVETIAGGLEWLGEIDMAAGLRNSLESMSKLGDGFAEKAQENALKATQAYRRFSEGAAQKSVTDYFASVELKAAEAAEKVAREAEKMKGFGAFDPEEATGGAEDRNGREGVFSQVNLHHMALAGTAGMSRPKQDQPVKAPGVESRLDQLIRVTKDRTAVAV